MMGTVDVEETINAVHDPGRVIHNLPPPPLVATRKREFGRLVDFLTTNDEWEDDNEIAHPPPAIMVVSGPKGFGKSTLTLQAAYRARQYADFKTIIWFNKQRFLELLLSEEDSVIPPNGPPRLRDEVDATVREFLAEPDSQQRLDMLLDFARQTEAVSEARRPRGRFIDRFLAAAYPYLLIIDDIDEDFHGRTLQICRELMRVRAPNKVILTSRTPDLEFGNEVTITPLRLGLLNSYQVDHLVRCKCDPDRLARQYWINENIDDTVQWTWANLGGLPDVIVHVFGKAKRESKPLDHAGYWPGILREYALNYIRDGSPQTADEIFLGLSSAEKYILATLAWSAPTGPRPTSRKNLLKLCAIHEEHPHRFDYDDAINDLYAKRFLGFEVATAISDELYQLHPFMHSVIQDKLESYWNDDYQQERTARLVEFFDHYSRTGEGRTSLVGHLDQGLTALSWLSDHQQWANVVAFGRILMDLLPSDEKQGAADRIEACRRIIAAAEMTRNANIEARYHVVLLHIARGSGNIVLAKEQNDVLIKFMEVFEHLDEEVRNSLATVYFDLALQDQKIEEAQQWLRRMNGDAEAAHQARLELADYYFQTHNYTEAVAEAKAVSRLRQQRQSRNTLDAQIYQLLGLAYSRLDQLDDSWAAYTQAATIAKSIDRMDLANEYLIAAEFIRMSSLPSPLESIGLPRRVSDWAGPKRATRCPICRGQINDLEQSTRPDWVCSGCQTRFHQDCMINLGITSCPSCGATIPPFEAMTGG